MLAQLGDIQFDKLVTPQSWGEGHKAEYGEISHILGKPAIQKTGTPLVEINLSVRLSSEFCQPGEQISALKEAMNSGKVLPFVTGDGAMVGKFIIVALSITAEKLSALGELDSASVEIGLKEYPEEPKDDAGGTALASSNPIPQASVTANPTPAGEISAAVSKGKTLGAQAQASLDSVKKGTASLKRGIREIKCAGEDAKAVYTEARSKALLTKKIVSRAGDFPDSLTEAIGYADNLAKIDRLMDTSAIQVRINNYQAGANKVAIRGARVAAFKATKEGGT